MSKSLEDYQKKRDFTKTQEPKGADAQSAESAHLSARRFVVQRHWARREHFDFRLEWKGVLLSWAVPKGPSFDPQDKRLAIQVEDHPLDYRNFEGLIPKGEYGGGTVMLWDEGFWLPVIDFDKGLRSGSVKIAVHGQRLFGGWALVRLAPDEKGNANNWLMIKEKDKFALDGDGISDFQTSVRTGRTKEQIEREG